MLLLLLLLFVLAEVEVDGLGARQLLHEERLGKLRFLHL
jgi:hypothetical protein